MLTKTLCYLAKKEKDEEYREPFVRKKKSKNEFERKGRENISVSLVVPSRCARRNIFHHGYFLRRIHARCIFYYRDKAFATT